MSSKGCNAAGMKWYESYAQGQAIPGLLEEGASRAYYPPLSSFLSYGPGASNRRWFLSLFWVVFQRYAEVRSFLSIPSGIWVPPLAAVSERRNGFGSPVPHLLQILRIFPNTSKHRKHRVKCSLELLEAATFESPALTSGAKVHEDCDFKQIVPDRHAGLHRYDL